MRCVAVIPALDPVMSLPQYVAELLRAGVWRVVVVNDGSSADYAKVFAGLEAMAQVTVLQHAENRGKGQALRTAFAHIIDAGWDYHGVVTVDADGQHGTQDVVRICRQIEPDQKTLWLGCRDFSQPQVPRRSYMGNRATSFFFRLLYGIRLPDTQTGLRGIPAAILPWQLNVAGDRFDYEMRVLIYMKRLGVQFREVPIATLYGESHSSHYRTVRDSWRIAKVLVGGKFGRKLPDLETARNYHNREERNIYG